MKTISMLLFNYTSSIICTLLLSTQILYAEQIAITNIAFDLDNKSIKKILLAKSSNSRLYFLKDSNKSNQFTRNYAGKSARSINRKWQRLVFSGRAKSPVLVEDVEEMIDRVSSDSKAVGHIDANVHIENPKVRIVK